MMKMNRISTMMMTTERQAGEDIDKYLCDRYNQNMN